MSLRDRAIRGSTRADRLFEHAGHPHTVLAAHAFKWFGQMAP